MDISRVDPELHNAVRRMPPLPIGNPIGRRLLRWLFRLIPSNSTFEGVTIEQRNDLQPPLRIYQPHKRSSSAALFWIHGGGFVMGQPAQDDPLCASTARKLGITVISVDYRLAPEYPFPIPLDDCYAGWMWLQQEAAALGLDRTKLILGGESAGGGLAATLAQRLYDQGVVQPLAQWLLYPMLDDRTATNHELHATKHFVWNNRYNVIGWRSFLGFAPGAASVPAYAVAARRDDLHGLPPTWIGVGDIDLFFEEDCAYAERLQAAGVSVSLDIVPAAPHGFQNWGASATISRNFIDRGQAWLQQVLASANA